VIEDGPRFTDALQFDANMSPPLGSYGAMGSKESKRFDGLTQVVARDTQAYDHRETIEAANDSKLWGFLKSDDDGIEDEEDLKNAEVVDMGKFDEQERPFLIID
jgi:hypothetical protein